MRKVFISISYQEYTSYEDEIAVMKEVLSENHLEGFVFVENFTFHQPDAKDMMRNAFHEIQTSALLIAEGTEKSIGVGIEAGFATAKNIPIVYVHKSNSEYSTTLGGSADFEVVYDSPEDLQVKLAATLSLIDL